jgi:hypothetical protein
MAAHESHKAMESTNGNVVVNIKGLNIGRQR